MPTIKGSGVNQVVARQEKRVDDVEGGDDSQVPAER